MLSGSVESDSEVRTLDVVDYIKRSFGTTNPKEKQNMQVIVITEN